MSQPDDFITENVAIKDLRPHPRNYVVHPADQIEHLMESIKEHKVYKNIVIARDNTILAGHGVVEACRKLGRESVPAVRLDLDPNEPRALKIVAGDNEISHLREVDDRALTEMLKEIKDFDVTGLLGTGYDEMMLANLVMVTRPQSEIRDFDEAAEWVGMPEYEEGQEPLKIVVSFRNEDDRVDFLKKLDLEIPGKADKATMSTWWPPRERADLSSVKFVA